MRKTSITLSIALCIMMIFSSLIVSGDTSGDNMLTLEEAKKIALENNTQYKNQQIRIEEANESYDEVYKQYSRSLNAVTGNVADRAKAEINRKIAIESAAIEVRQEIFTRKNLERTSNYNVTKAYYDVVKAKYALEAAKNDMDLKKKELDVAKVRLDQGIITKNSYVLSENTYRSAQIAYNKAFADLQNYMKTLGTTIGMDLDPYYHQIDMNIEMADINYIDLNAIKEDFMKNCNSAQYGMFYSLKEQLDLAQYRLDLTQEKYDYYYERNPNKTSGIISSLNEALYRAKTAYDSAKYQLENAEKSLDVALQSMYVGLSTTAETIENLRKTVEDTKVTVEQNKILYEHGLISKLDLDKSEYSLKDLENQLKTLIVDFNIQHATLTQFSDPVEVKE